MTDRDSARAETAIPLPPAALLDFLADHERLLRLNPQLDIEKWQRLPGGFRLVAQNDSNGRRIDTAVSVEATAGELILRYADGLKQSTTLAVEPGDDGARLVVTEHYPRIEDAADPRLVDVDKSLVPWVAALRRHLLARQRWGRLPLLLPLWRWWNERFMLSMAPRNRRIVRLLVWVSVLEFAVFLAAIVVLRAAS